MTENGIIVVDKPAGWTSFDVVAKLRGILQTRRLGHTGTLDPMATGVLPICVNKATRVVELLTCEDKQYFATIKLGETYDSLDVTGKLLTQAHVDATLRQIEQCVNSFVGKQQQLPPMFSAVKVDGVRLYKLGRQGVEITRQPREIEIYSINIVDIQLPFVSFNVHCSKGTYIRSLASDIGKRLNCGAALAALRRTKSGQFTEKQMLSLEQISVQPILISLNEVFSNYPVYCVSAQQAVMVKNGVPIAVQGVENELVRVTDVTGELLCLSRRENGMLKMVRGFY